jgi:small subunit ribosomal protein S9
MADQTPPNDEPQPETPERAADEQAPEAAAPEQAVEETAAPEQAAEETAAPEPTPEEAAAAQAVPQAADADAPQVEAAAAEADAPDEDADEEPQAPRVKPEIPGADLEVDIVFEGEERPRDPYAEDDEGPTDEAAGEDEDVEDQPIKAAIELAADARYRATGKRKTAIARVILKPGTGAYTINGRTLDEFFPRHTLQRTIRQPLETVGYEDRMDVIARMQGGGVSAQAGALRHGISRALLEADPNLRSELKRRGFLTRDARVKERKKAGLKKARKRPQFSKR